MTVGRLDNLLTFRILYSLVYKISYQYFKYCFLQNLDIIHRQQSLWYLFCSKGSIHTALIFLFMIPFLNCKILELLHVQQSEYFLTRGMHSIRICVFPSLSSPCSSPNNSFVNMPCFFYIINGETVSNGKRITKGFFFFVLFLPHISKAVTI